MIKSTSYTKKLMKLLHKFNRYNKREKWFMVYLLVLLFCLIFLPIVKISSLRWSGWESFWLLSGTYFKTMLVIMISMIVLIWRNASFKFKNMFFSFFWWRDNEAIINFLFLFIITTAFFGITDTVSLTQREISRISISFRWNFIQILLLVGLIMTLISVVKTAQETWKKTKIINMVDEEHKKIDHTKDDIKKWLFG